MNISKYEYKAHKFIKIIFHLIFFVVGFLIGLGVKTIKIDNILCTILGIDNVHAATFTINYENSAFGIFSSGYDLDTKLEYLEENFINVKKDVLFTQYNIFYYDGNFIVTIADGSTPDTSYLSRFNFFKSTSGYSYQIYFNISNRGQYGYFKIPLDDDFNSHVDYYATKETMSSEWLFDYNSTISGSKTLFSSGTSGMIQTSKYPLNTLEIPTDAVLPILLDSSHSPSYVYNSKNDDDFLIKAFGKEYRTKSCYNCDFAATTKVPTYYSLLKKNTTPLEFNENLFANDDNFYKYCAKAGSSYAITRINNPDNLDYMTDYDYIWFPYGLNGFHISNYLNSDASDLESTPDGTHLPSDNIFEFENISYDFFKDKETINSIISDKEKIENYKFKGYTDMRSYYGWSSLLFLTWFDYRDGNNFNFFPIIDFDLPTKIKIGSSGNLHGGGGFHLDQNGNVNQEDSNYCFYVKKDYVVTEVHKDSFGDYFGDVPTQNGDFSFETYVNKNNYGIDTSFGTITTFISNIANELIFIKDTVFNFFMELPSLLKLFFISVFSLLLIKIIIGMVTR